MEIDSYYVEAAVSVGCFFLGMQCIDLHRQKISLALFVVGLIAAGAALFENYIWPYYVADQWKAGIATALIVVHFLLLVGTSIFVFVKEPVFPEPPPE